MDVERPIIIEADTSEWPYEFVRWSNGASTNTAGECWGVCGVGREFDWDKYIERVSVGIGANDGGEKLVQFLLFIWSVCFQYASKDGSTGLESTGGSREEKFRGIGHAGCCFGCFRIVVVT